MKADSVASFHGATDGTLLATAADIAIESLKEAHQVALQVLGSALPVPVSEALGEAVITAAAARAAHRRATTESIDRDEQLVLQWRIPRLVATTLAELMMACPGFITAEGYLSGLGRAADGDANRLERILARGSTELAIGLLGRVDRDLSAFDGPDDVIALARSAHGGLVGTIPDEWQGSPLVRIAGLPHLLTPLADLLITVRLLEDVAADAAVIARRHAYRHLRGAVPEGLTPRHLARTQSLIEDALRWQL